MPPAPSSDEPLRKPDGPMTTTTDRLRKKLRLLRINRQGWNCLTLSQLAHPLPFAFFHHHRSALVLSLPTLIMAYNPPLHADSDSNLPSSTLPSTDSALGLSLMSELDENALLSLYSSSVRAFGEPWSPSTVAALSAEFGFQNCASNAPNPEIPSTQGNVGGQAYPYYSPWPVPSPATSTGSLSSLGVEQSLDNTLPFILPPEYSGVAFPSPATMGNDIPLPFFVESSPQGDSTAHAAQSTPAHTIPGAFLPSNAASSFVSPPVVPPAKPNLVRASSTPAQGEPLRQESHFVCSSCFVERPWVSFVLSRFQQRR